ncbi:hypothetical protein [Vallitalea sp.]|jgi:fibronectin type 3 domain-containing protein|uniref:hypothetical protein n=1 Tax=Vallitalea sp. TaxID=1882829 RepID=UPI0025E3484C|nr:hypothetical protein [Vallitalea sp.]MCT4688901.1 hypothetical protein [Vallitalea sp.]
MKKISAILLTLTIICLSNITVNAEVPTIPSNVRMTGNEVTIEWDSVKGATEYKVKRSTEENGLYETIGEHIIGTSYKDVIKDYSHDYYYVVTAVNSDGESVPSEKVKWESGNYRYMIVEFYDSYKLGGSYSGINIAEIKLFNSNGQQINYTIPVCYDSKTDGEPEYNYISKLMDNNLSTNGLFCYTAGQEFWTRLVLEVPNNKEVSKAEIYTGIYRKPREINIYQAHTYNYNTNLKGRDNNGLKYFGKSQGNNVETAEKYIITRGDTTLNAKGGNNKITLNWEAIDGMTQYSVKRALNEDGPYTVIANNITSTTYIDKTVNNGDEYYYVVTATNNENIELSSNKVKASASSINHLILEFEDHYDSTSTNVNEIKVYNNDGEEVNYSVSEVFDSAINGNPQLWNDSTKGKISLNDKQTDTYTSMNYSSSVGSGTWTRVVLDFEANNGISKVETWVGSTNKPQKINIYEAEQYNFDSNIKNRDNTGIEIFGEAFIKDKAVAEKYTISKSKLNAPRIIANANNGYVQLKWEDINNAAKYTIKRSITEDGPYNIVSSNVTDTTYNDTSVVNGITYYYVVTANNTEGESSNSNEVRAKVSAANYLLVDVYDHYDGNSTYLSEMEVYDNNGEKINYTVINAFDSAVNGTSYYWNDTTYGRTKLNDNDLATFYCINRTSKAGDGTWTRLVLDLEDNNGISKINMWTAGEAKPKEIKFYEAVQYSYEKNVRNRNNEGIELFGEAFINKIALKEKYTVTKSYIEAPTNVQIVNNKTKAELNWNEVEGATGYTIRRASTAKGPYNTIAKGITENTYTDTTVVSGQEYYYVVTASNSMGESSYSKEVQVNTSSTRYLIVEIYDHYDGSSAYVNEIDVYNSRGENIDYKVVQGFDSAVNGTPYYWSNTTYGRTKLKDDNLATSFCINRTSKAGDGTWTRLVLDLENNDGVSKVSVWTDDEEIPQKITIYEADKYNYDTNIKNRNNIGIELFGEAFINNIPSTKEYDINKSYLNAPTKLKLNNKNDQVQLNWVAVDGATGYNVKRSKKENGPYDIIANNVMGETYTDDTVNNGFTYYYVVSAVNNRGESSPSNKVKISVTAARYLIVEVYDHYNLEETYLNEIEIYNSVGKKINYTVTEGYDSSVNGTPYYWNNETYGKEKLKDNNYATMFSVNRKSTAGEGTWTRLVLDLQSNTGISKVNVWTNSMKKPKKVTFYEARQYDYKTNIKGRDNIGLELFGEAYISSNEVAEKYIITKSYLEAPRNLTVKGGNKRAELTWNQVDGATGYNIKRSKTPQGPYELVANNIANTSYLDQTVMNGSTYYYVVTALDNNGESSNSNEVNVKVSATQYLIVEVYDHYGNNDKDPTNINELELFDCDGKKINYTPIEAFDSVTNGLPYYWNDANNGYTKLNDDNKSSASAVKSLCQEGTGSWMRFVLKLHSNSGISKADIWTNSINKPRSVNIYEALSYDYLINVRNRNNTGLIDFGSIDMVDNGVAEKYTVFPKLPQSPSTINYKEQNGQINFVWSSVTNANSYTIRRATVSGGPYTVIADGLRQTQYVDNTGVNNTHYYYVITSVNSAGESEYSKEITATPHIIIPKAPAHLVGKPAASSVNLTWNVVSTADTYTVKRSQIDGGPYIEIAKGLTSTSYLDTGLLDGSTYYYVVSAVNQAGESQNSAQLKIRAGAVALNAPTNLTAIADNQRITLSWNIVNHATGYKIKRATNQGGPYVDIVGDILSNSFVDTNLINKTTYYYIIIATNDEEESEASVEVSATPGIFIPEPVLNFVGLANDNQVTLSWDVNEKADSYIIKRALTPNGQFSIIAQGLTGTSYIDTTAVNNTSYYYVVTAANKAGESTNSATILVIPKAKEGKRVILALTLTNGMQKDYDLSQTQLVEFLNWYRKAVNNDAMPYFTIIKGDNKGPYLSNKDYIIFEKILYFEINEYTK